tara:strand:- start:5845 stop:6177 length:333 start_codon:yes stop_codon:yes gene_type:complete
MSYSKDKDHNLEGDITFKQSWKLAHNFARQCKDLFPQFEHKALANLFSGAIYYHHEGTGKKLTKQEASEMISDESNVPDCYIQEVQDFLSKNDKNESITNISGIEDLPRE